MKRIAYMSIATLLSAAALSSCSDFLDANNKSAGTDSDSYYATETGKEAARVNAFAALKPIVQDKDINTSSSDLYKPVRGKTPSELSQFTNLDAQNSTCSDYYTNCFDLVQQASLLNEKADEGSAYAAEGLFLRDYAYYLLTQQFGGVPYIDHYVSDANREYPKYPVEDIYNILIEDLTGLYNDSALPSTAYDGSVSKQAVAFLLAKVYLAQGWDCNTTLNSATGGTYTVNSTSAFSSAAEWAVKAINGQSLTQTFEQKWAPSNENNSEFIWCVEYERNAYPGDVSSDGHGWQNAFGSYYGEPTATGYKYCESQRAPSEKAMALWDEGDTRYDGTFMTRIYGYTGTWGTTGYFAYYNASDTASMPYAFRYYPAYTTTAQVQADVAAHQSKFAKVGNESVIAFILSSEPVRFDFNNDGSLKSTTSITITTLDGLVYGGATVKKFDDPDTPQESGSTNGYRDIVLFDLSDAYLTAAEAYLMAGSTTQALQYLNAVRTRAKAGTLSSFGAYEPLYSIPGSMGDLTSLDVILDERARELYGQNMRYTDLRRTKQLVRYNVAFNDYISSVNDMTGVDGNVKWYRPIPQTAFDSNIGLTDEDQNPGY